MAACFLDSISFLNLVETLGDSLKEFENPRGGALYVVLPLWLLNKETTDLAPTFVKSEGDFKPPLSLDLLLLAFLI
jgi:hypothetical protein